MKALSELLENTWKMESAIKKVLPSKQSCKEAVHENSHNSYAESCNRKWLCCALEVLQENNVYSPYNSDAVPKLLHMEHEKNRNILLMSW